MHQIENEHLKVRVIEYGAELTSVVAKKSGVQHLWQADPDVWGWHAPVLFPVIGRCMNDQILVEGNVYPMEKHGFARKSDFKVLELNETKIVFSLTSNSQTKNVYPFDFEFLIAYRLNSNELICTYEVINTNQSPIYFQLGGHPAFTIPFFPNEKYEDYFLEFESSENSSRHYINTEGYFDGRKESILQNSKTIQLRKDLFKDDALIFKDLNSRAVSIKSKKHSHSLKVSFQGFDYLGIWAKENAPYVCIEPWVGCADSADFTGNLSDKEGVIKLQPGDKIIKSFSVSIV